MRRLFLASKLATLFWGLFAVVFSYQVERIAPTVLEAINKIGSMANGPLLALFCTAVFIPVVGQRAAICGFCAGLAANLAAWLLLPYLSWLWWNPLGFAIALSVTLITGSSAIGAIRREDVAAFTWPRRQSIQLVTMAVLILLSCLGLEYIG